MIYQLECPNCLAINEIESEEAVIQWSCDSCNARPLSSLPTDEEGNLI